LAAVRPSTISVAIAPLQRSVRSCRDECTISKLRIQEFMLTVSGDPE
jgi:hypothetical protein